MLAGTRTKPYLVPKHQSLRCFHPNGIRCGRDMRRFLYGENASPAKPQGIGNQVHQRFTRTHFLQTFANPSNSVTTEPAGVALMIAEVLHSSGHPIDPDTRGIMESRFGHDFSQVRVHDDAKATASARGVGARAFTIENHIIFGSGQYALSNMDGVRLLSHELTHVVQQRSSQGPRRQDQLLAGNYEVAAEREAVQSAAKVSRRKTVSVHEKPGSAFQGTYLGAGLGAGLGALSGAAIGLGIGSLFGPLGLLIGAGIGALAGGIAGGFVGSYLTTPLSDMSTYQSPGASGWWGAKFGCYRNNCTRRHKGWDIYAPVGTEVRAVTAGEVTHGENPPGWGHYIRLKSHLDEKRVYLYAHLSARKPAGDYLPGQKIGETGTSGIAQASRPHLHFEVLDGVTRVDPDKYFAEPSKVIETTGSAPVEIDKSAAPPCAPC